MTRLPPGGALLAIVALLQRLHAHSAAVDFDVVVYGSSPAGIGAATAAGQLGMNVALFEPLGMIGGMGAAGALGLHDEGGIHGIDPRGARS